MTFSQLHINLGDTVQTLLPSWRASARPARRTTLSRNDYVFILTVDKRDIIFIDGIGAIVINSGFNSVNRNLDELNNDSDRKVL